MQLNPANAARRGTATLPAARLLAFLLAILVAVSLVGFGTAHAHGGEAHIVNGYADVAANAPHGHQAHAHSVPCDEDHADEEGQDDCCMSATSCAVCVPVPSGEITFGIAGILATPAMVSASLPRDPPTLSRPPKLSVIA